MSCSSSPRRRRRGRCHIVQRIKFAGHASPDLGTNVQQIAEYLSNFAGPNSAKRHHWNKAYWVRRYIRRDDTADYYCFDLNTTVGLPGTTLIVPGFRQACERATVRLNPSFSKSHPERHDPQSSVGVILLPAVSASGRLHPHGWIRIPRSASQALRPVCIQVKGVDRVIQAPEALATFVHLLVDYIGAPFRPQRWGQTTSLWIANRDGRAASTRIDGLMLSYLLKTADNELRKWDDLEFIPHKMFVRMEDQIQARRDDRALHVRAQRRAITAEADGAMASWDGVLDVDDEYSPGFLISAGARHGAKEVVHRSSDRISPAGRASAAGIEMPTTLSDGDSGLAA